MKELSDDELQQWLQQQLGEDGHATLPGNSDDTALYNLLFTALADEPAVSPNSGLADAVVKKIQAQDQKAELMQFYMVVAAVLIGGAMFAYFAINYINPDAAKPILSFIAIYKWIIVFVILCIAGIEMADKVLVKRKFSVGS